MYAGALRIIHPALRLPRRPPTLSVARCISTVLPEAKRALASLDCANALGVKIPYILVGHFSWILGAGVLTRWLKTTNGGVGEDERSARLTTQLGVPAHIILKSHAHEYPDKNVLVLGERHEMLRKVAEGYGFKNVYTTSGADRWYQCHPKCS
ncbi:hypothetical protein FA95DRAFT_1573736 [Auriscalpium vulgare]|uniref:Uncharacterized protein n=1 Tax=Auriscalpium vulgare TaxID=40419 RepID=A0ACB8RNM1_9AGAM|nr:hypothetical protein FA95DRAFT_1573736 [Auriscalpium vulgare]